MSKTMRRWSREDELELVEGLRRGLTNGEIGQILGINETSVHQKHKYTGFLHLTPEELERYSVMPAKTWNGGGYRKVADSMKNLDPKGYERAMRMRELYPDH